MIEKWIIGVLVNLGGNICINIGTNCVKYDHARSRLHQQHHTSSLNSTSSALSSGEQLLDGMPSVPIPPPNLHSSFCSRLFAPLTSCWSRFIRHGRWWYVGWSFFTIGNIGNFVSFSLTSQSLLAGLGSSQFLMNSICEWYFNDQRITPRIMKATLMIIIGNTLIVAFASHASPILTVDVIFQLLFETAFDIYIVILLVLCLVLQIYYNETRKKLREYQTAMVLLMEQGEQVHINLDAAGDHALGVAVHGSLSPHQAQLLAPPPTPLSAWRLKMLPFSYAAVSAIIGTQSVLLAKATSDLLRTSVSGEQQFTSAFTWVILVGWASTIVFWLYRMDTALRKFDGPFIVPVLQVVWTLFSIIGGGIFFEEFNRMSSLAVGLFTLGVAVMMGGVYLLAPAPQPHHLHHDDARHAIEMQNHRLATMHHHHHHHVHSSDSEGAMIHMHGASSPYDNGMRKENTGNGSSDNTSSGNSHSVVTIVGGSSNGGGVMGKDEKPSGKVVTRVTSTGRILIQSDDRRHRGGGGGGGGGGDDDVYIEMSPDFGSYKSAVALSPTTSSGQNTATQQPQQPSKQHPNPNNIGRLTGGPGSRYQSNAEQQAEHLISDGDENSSCGLGIGGLSQPPDEKTRSTSVDEMILPMRTLRDLHLGAGGGAHAAAMEKPGLMSGGNTPRPSSSASSSSGAANNTNNSRSGQTSPLYHHHHHHHHHYPPTKGLKATRSSGDRGILGEAGLLDGVGMTTTPPLRPAVHWGTPDRPNTADSIREFSRPPSASGGGHLQSHDSATNSIPPSPALSGYDPSSYNGATKRSRSFSLGFSIPMVELGDSP